MMSIVVLILAFLGAFLVFLASVGILRMPDLFLRMSATAKAGTLGVGFMLLAAILHFQNFVITSRALAIIVFLFLTAPVAAHMNARAAYFDGTPLWEGTVRDDLKYHYQIATHTLDSQAHPAEESPAITVVEGDDFTEEG